MKNLRKKNPQLQALREQLQAPAAQWRELSQAERLSCCVQFLLLPVLEKGQPLTPELVESVTPAATDVMLQAGLLLEQTPQLFQTVRQLIEGTVSLFLLPEED